MATEYKVPVMAEPAPPKANEVVLVTSGDLRHSANVMGWPAQQVLDEARVRLGHRAARLLGGPGHHLATLE